MNRGFGLVELVVAIAIVSVTLFGFLATARDLKVLSESNADRLQAAFLLEEGVELLRTMRDSGWSAQVEGLATETTYYFDYDGATFLPEAALGESEDLGKFSRSFTMHEVYRDLNHDIVGTGNLDEETKRFLVNVSWTTRSGNENNLVASTYLTNFFDE